MLIFGQERSRARYATLPGRVASVSIDICHAGGRFCFRLLREPVDQEYTREALNSEKKFFARHHYPIYPGTRGPRLHLRTTKAESISSWQHLQRKACFGRANNAGLDACRVSLNSAHAPFYEAYWRQLELHR